MSCKKTNLKTESKIQNSAQLSEEIIFNQIPLECYINDDIVDNCRYNDLKIKINYTTTPNSINFDLKDIAFYYNFDFYFEGIGSKALLFTNKDTKILLLEFEYEYSIKLFIFKITENTSYFLKEMEYQIASDGNNEVIYKLTEKNNKLNLSFVNRNAKKIIEINYAQEIELKNKLDSELVEDKKEINPLKLNGTWGVNCNNELTELNIDGEKGYLSLYDFNSIYINVDVVKSSVNDEYLLKFNNTSSQKKFYSDKLSIADEEISKDKIIGKLKIRSDNKAELNWIGLYNTKLEKLEFVGDDFLMIKENGGRQPVVLEKCN
jgi:hypothetical protein